MQFFTRLMGLDSIVSRSRRGDRPHRRRQAQFTLETLEDRDLKATGITMQYGMINIAATEGVPNNTASVAIDPSNNMIKVTLNGESEEYNQGDVWTVGFNGSQNGSNTFTNDTSLTETAIGYGGNNHFTGGSSFNVIFLYGDSNYFDAQGAYSYAFTFNGPNNTIPAYSNEQVFAYSYDSSWF